MKMSESTSVALAIKCGQEAWKRIEGGATWDDWMCVGEALDLGQRECMRAANTNKPEGPEFRDAMSVWLGQHGFDAIDKGVRSRLLDLVHNRSEIEKMRREWKSNDRIKLNHPNSVWRKWKNLHNRSVEKNGHDLRVTDKDKIAMLEHRIEQLQANGGELFDLKKDTAHKIAGVLYEHLNESKLRQIAGRIWQLLETDGLLAKGERKKIKGDIKQTVHARFTADRDPETKSR
jgi:hypothetical protein